jgi:HAE1 family hydrophobic/amphiphilic exporter-1
MNSVSSAGETRITLQFSLSRNIDAAAQDVQTAISQASRQLPIEMPNPPSMRKMNPADAPILFIALTGDNVQLTALDDYAENYISPQLSMADGVAQVGIYGSQQYAVRIHLNPDAMTNRNLNIDQVGTAIQNLNSNKPTGTLQTSGYYQLIKVSGQLNNASEFADSVIASSNGAPVRLRDVSPVEDSTSNDIVATWYNDKRAIVLAIQRQPGANTVAVVKNVLDLLPTLTSKLPDGARLQVVYDRSSFIKDSIKDVQYTLLFAALLVIGVIFLFFNNITPTIIAVFSLPISIIATFGVMYLLNYNIDNLSLMGLVLAVGFVIDDAVVVLENIMRHIEHGLDRVTASLKGSQEISFTVIAMTLSLVAVFIPIFFMQGIVGRLFNEFAAVVGIAILFSGIISLTFVPMLCSRFLSDKKTQQAQKISKFEHLFLQTKNSYEKSLRLAITHKKIVLNSALAILGLTFVLFYVVSKGFIPAGDADIVFGTVKAPEAITFSDFLNRTQAISSIILKNKNIAGMISSVGQGSGAAVSSNTARLVINLKPRSQRSKDVEQVIQQLQHQLQNVAGLQIGLTNPAGLNIGGKSSSGNYQYTMQGVNFAELQHASQQMQAQIAKISGVHSVDTDLELNNPELKLDIMRDKAAELGITPAQIESALYSAYGERQISSIMTANGDYAVIMDIDPKYQRTIDDLNALNLQSTTGKMIPLAAVVTTKQSAGLLEVNHYGQLPAVTISFNLAPGVSIGDVATKINKIAKQTLPSGISGSFAGMAKTFQSSLSSLPWLLLFTILVIYMVLAILYENFIHPLTILTALPFAIFGALFTLIICNQELNIFSFIGLIMLIGLTKKNGIMMVDFAIAARREQCLTADEAIVQACLIRFRPIMMTTMAAILATLPIALGLGAGGETRRALGISVVGGLLFSQFITLYVTPIFYLLMDRFTSKHN